MATPVVRSDDYTRLYEEIRSGALLSERRFEAYHYLFYLGPSTASEVAQAMMANGARVHGGRSGPGNVGARLCELVSLNVAREVGVRRCTATGNEVMSYDITDQRPNGVVVKPKGPVRPAGDVMRQAALDIRSGHYTPSVEALLVWIETKF